MAQNILRQEERAETIEARLEIRRSSLLVQFCPHGVGAGPVPESVAVGDRHPREH